MRKLCACIGFVAVLSPALALAGPEAPPPTAPVTAVLPDRSVTLWPYTGSDYSLEPYDPVNLLFLDLDPRAIRQALLSLDGERPGLAGLPFAGCTWADAMGSEQVVWAEAAGWVGGEVQLVCIEPSAPLGDPFRVHMRLYRQHDVTLGAAHFEFLIPGTPQHEVLSWDFARDFVALDMGRAGLVPAAPPVGLQPAGSFREIRRPIYDALFFGGARDLLVFLGLALPPPSPPPPAGPVDIPTSGTALVLGGDLPFDPIQEKIRTQIDVDFNVVVPRPFCAEGPLDLVHLQGPVHLALHVHTNPSGAYERRHRIWGTLNVTPVAPDGMGGYDVVGPTSTAVVAEDHRALLTDRYGQLREVGSQDLRGDPVQSLRWRLDGGHSDRYDAEVSCGF